MLRVRGKHLCYRSTFVASEVHARVHSDLAFHTLGTGPGALCVAIKMFEGVTATVRTNSPRAEADSSQGSASRTCGTWAASRPTDPATSATPVQLTWKLSEPVGWRGK